MIQQEDLVIVCHTLMSEDTIKSLKDIEVVRDFGDVFLEEFSLPLIRDIKFGIDLLPRIES